MRCTVMFEVKTIMHLDNFENFTFQLWPLFKPQFTGSLSLSLSIPRFAGASGCSDGLPWTFVISVFGANVKLIRVCATLCSTD